MTDPPSSDRTVKSIVVDGFYAQLIMDYAEEQTASSPSGRAWFNDTEIWLALEARLGRRLQRNVIARARGRMVELALLVPVGAHDYDGTSLEHYALPARTPAQLVLAI
jgi:hypothetical protein